MMRGLVGLVGAIIVAVTVVAMGRAQVAARSFATRTVQSRRSVRPGAFYAVADAASTTDNFGDDATPSDQDITRRRYEYAAAFEVSAAILLVAIIVAFRLRHRSTAAAGIAALAALGMGALLQFTASKGLPMFLWPPPHLWLGTFAANFMLAVMFAGVGGTMLRPGTRRVMGSIVIAEISWWAVPAFAGAAGLTLGIARQRFDMDWLMFLGTAVGAVAAPAAGWATASLAAALAERITPGRT
jgi:hypothetical protein